MNLQNRVRASKEDEEDVLGLSELEDGTEPTPSETGSRSADAEDLEQSVEGSGSEPSQADPRDALASVSFGALASAQESLGRKRKRDEPTASAQAPRARSSSPFHEAAERQAGQGHSLASASRGAKHAPQEVSSKKAVSRKRGVVAVPKRAARDPRFSVLSGPLDEHRVAQNYGFLKDYRAAEMAELKRRIRETKDEAGKERLRRELGVMEDQERGRGRDEERRKVLQEHRKGEREKVKAGKKPFFLKRAEVKKQATEKRFEGMGKRRAAKALEKRTKRLASKEKKHLPRVRRSAATTSSERQLQRL